MSPSGYDSQTGIVLTGKFQWSDVDMHPGNDWQDLSNALESLSRPVGKVATKGKEAILIKLDPDCAACLAAVSQEPCDDRPKRRTAA